MQKLRRLNEERYKLHYLPNIIRVVKSRIRWAGHVEHILLIRNSYNISVEKRRGKAAWETNMGQ